jgi:hypothetical protein
VVLCSDPEIVADDQPGMTGVIAEDRGKGYLRPAVLLNQRSLLRNDRCWGLSLLSVSCSTTTVFHHTNLPLDRSTLHLCRTIAFDHKERSPSEVRQGFEVRA